MMLLYKILFHFNAFIGLRLMKMVYKLWGIKLEFGTKVTYRKGFSLIIGNKGEVKIGDKVFFNNYCSRFLAKMLKYMITTIVTKIEHD